MFRNIDELENKLPTGRFLLAPAEGCYLGLYRSDPSGSIKSPTCLGEHIWQTAYFYKLNSETYHKHEDFTELYSRLHIVSYKNPLDLGKE